MAVASMSPSNGRFGLLQHRDADAIVQQLLRVSADKLGQQVGVLSYGKGELKKCRAFQKPSQTHKQTLDSSNTQDSND